MTTMAARPPDSEEEGCRHREGAKRGRDPYVEHSWRSPSFRIPRSPKLNGADRNRVPK
jgi:hypothetical protein